MKTSDLFDELQFVYDKKLRERWRSGKLPIEWRKKYPQLFNDKDLSLTRPGSVHIFFEWLTAILLYAATGYISYHKCNCANHCEKYELFTKLTRPKVYEEIENLSGFPDLFVVAPDLSKWFFCEIKGPTDSVDPKQKKVARKILKLTGRKVMLVSLWPVDAY